MGGSNRCAVYGCSNDRRYKSKWIIKDHVPELKFHLCPPKWRSLWVKLINRKNLPKITDHTRICSNHFVLGKPIGIQPHPSLYMSGYSDKDSHSDNIEIQRIISSWSLDNDESTYLTTRQEKVKRKSAEDVLDGLSSQPSPRMSGSGAALLSSSMMQAGVYLRQDTETTLPGLKEEESIHMAESETECAVPGLNTLEPECVTAHSGVSDVEHTHTLLIKTETDLGSTQTGDLKTESLGGTELGYVTHLHPDQIKTELDDGGYLKAEHNSDLQDIKCVRIKSDEMKCESSESLVSDLMNTVKTEAGVDHKDRAEPRAGERSPNCKTEDIHDLPTSADLHNHCDTNIQNNLTRIGQKSTVEVEIHTSEKPYKCPQCQKGFRRKSDLNLHRKIHTGETPHKCIPCGKCFRSNSSLNVHLRIHTGEKPYKCTQCGKCFSTLSNLNSHLKIHSGEKPFKCSQCGNCFSSKLNLNVHQRIHTSEKPHKCTQCGKCFSQMCNLISHQRIHTAEKPYKCTECGKCFSKESALNSHWMIHTDENPNSCSQCGKCFYTKSYLKSHQRIHSGEIEKTCICIQCGKCFRSNSSLNAHMRTHTGEMPYKCTHCGKCYNAKSSLSTHMRIHTSEKPYK